MPAFTTRPEIRGTFGVVASTHWIASAVGMSVLEKGGNAFDAAAAAGFTLQVVEPHLNGPLGEAPILVWSEANRRCEMICGQGVAPAAATIARFRELGLDLIPGTGLLAAAVPGGLRRLDAAVARLRDDAARRDPRPGDRLCRERLPGGPSDRHDGRHGRRAVPPGMAEFCRDLSAERRAAGAGTGCSATRLSRRPTAVSFPKPAMAAARARSSAPANAWYRGFVAEAIDRFCRREKVLDASGRRHGGLLTGDDMARWEAPVEAPLTFDYHGYTVAKGGPWSQGPVLLQQLALLQGFDLDDLDPLGPDFVHLVVECAKLAFADREAWYGDPDFVDVPMAPCSAPTTTMRRRKLVGEHASLELRPGSPDGRMPRVLVGGLGADGCGPWPTSAASASRPSPSTASSPGTPAISMSIDRWGNMVSATPSGGWLQSSPVIPELGFCLGTRMQMFWLEEGLPASLAPGKRPRSTLSPSMAFKDGEPYLAFGTPGGDQQDQWSTLMFLHHVHHGMNLQEAIDCPAFHTEHMPSSFYPRAAQPGVVGLESRFPEATRAALARRGHRLRVGDAWSEGRLSGCAREETPEGRGRWWWWPPCLRRRT